MKRLVLVLILLWPVAGYSRVAGYSPGDSPVAGDSLDGNFLMDLCDGTAPDEPNEDVAGVSICLGYLRGILDATVAWESWGHIKPKLICKPSGVTTGQLRQVFLKYMRQHPENWHLPGSVLMLNALKGAWPCKE
jgi:hypothetical protein